MADTDFDGRQLEELTKALLDAFPTEGSFAQFVNKAVDITFSQKRTTSYEETLLPLIESLQSDGWLREFVRKAVTAKPGNGPLQAFVNHPNVRKQLGEQEFIAVLEDAQLEWDVLHECMQSSGARADLPANLAAHTAGIDAAQTRRLYAQRLGDIVDHLAAAPQDPALALKFPLLRFAALLLRRVERDDTAYRLRVWIRNAARQRDVPVFAAVLIYLSPDRESATHLLQALRLRRVSVDAEEWPEDEPHAWRRVLSVAKEHIGRTIVFIAPGTRDRWAMPSDGTDPAVDADAGSVCSAIFTVLAGLGPLTLPRFLQSAPLTWAATAPTLQEVNLVAERITRQTRPTAGRTRSDQKYVADVAPELAKKLRKDEVVVLVGPAASWPPTGYALARALLARPTWKLANAHVAVPADLASTYCALKVGDDDFSDELQAAWNDVAGSSETPQNIPRAYGLLADLLDELPRHRLPIRTIKQENRRPVIVSTNRDLMLERALLLKGVSFSRVVVVQRRVGATGSPEVSFVVNEYRATRLDDRVRLEHWTPEIDRDAPTFQALDDAVYKCCVSQVKAVEEVDRMILDGDPDWPVLFKYHGSYDHPGGCSITIEDYDALGADIVPQQILTRVRTKPLLLLGYSCTDPEWRHLRRTILRNLASSHEARYAVQYPIPEGDEEVYFQIERALEDRMASVWQSANIRNYLVADGETVLEEILRQLPQGA